MHKGIKGIIFDFDGVIVKSIQVKSEAFAELYAPYGVEIVKKVIEHHESNGGMSRFEKIINYHQTFLNIELAETELSVLADQFSDLVVDGVTTAPYMPGALEYIQNNYGKYKLFISTGTPTNEIKKILEKRSIIEYFDGVFGSPQKKVYHIEQIFSKSGFKSDEVIFFGDSETDLNAAKTMCVEFILISNDYNAHLLNQYTGRIINDYVELL